MQLQIKSGNNENTFKEKVCLDISGQFLYNKIKMRRIVLKTFCKMDNRLNERKHAWIK